MSLDWNLGKIKDYKSLCWIPDPTPEEPNGETFNPVTNALIMALMSIGMSKITEANHLEVFFRLTVDSSILGAPMFYRDENGDPEENYFSLKDVKAHIGLSTNVSWKTSGQWIQSVKRRWLERSPS